MDCRVKPGNDDLFAMKSGRRFEPDLKRRPGAWATCRLVSSCVGIERKQLLRACDAAQRVSSHRNEAAPDVSDIGKRR
jgi:hypothetical protein